MFQALLFDFDGTLTPSLEFWLQAYKHALTKLGKDLSEQTIIDKFFYRNFAEIIEEFDLPRTDELSRLIKEGLLIAFETATLFPDVPMVLEHCKAHNVKIAMVTSASRNLVEASLIKFGIDKYFDFLVTADETVNFKPHPDPVLAALRALDVAPEQTLFVGDYVVDVLSGRAAGTKTALFFPESHHRFYKLSELQETKPDFFFSHYSDLLVFLNEKSITASGITVEI